MSRSDHARKQLRAVCQDLLRTTQCEVRTCAQDAEDDFQLAEDMDLQDGDGGGPDDSGGDDGQQPDELPGAADEGGDFKEADVGAAEEKPAGQDEEAPEQSAHGPRVCALQWMHCQTCCAWRRWLGSEILRCCRVMCRRRGCGRRRRAPSGR